MNAPIITLGDAIPVYIDRCKELLVIYTEIGPSGNFGKAMIQREIEIAERAMREGDIVQMVKSLDALKKCS